MIRKIIRIDEAKCNGCGLCARACHEGAIDIVDGKAKLTRENYCDGLGDCLPGCPRGAITFEEREAPAYDEAAVLASKREKAEHHEHAHHSAGCPGAQARQLLHNDELNPAQNCDRAAVSRLAQWPCQIRLVPVSAPYFKDAELLIAADCTAYAYANFHENFMKGKITLIGCPKLDDVDYSEKLTEILKFNDIRNITLLRMEVPCCGGLAWAAETAIQNSGKSIPLQVITISIEGRLLTDL